MTDPIIQVVAEAVCLTHIAPERIADHPDPRMAVAACFECQRRAEDVVAAVVPLIRAQIADQIEAQVEQSDDYFLSSPALSEFWKGRASGLRCAARIARGDAQ